MMLTQDQIERERAESDARQSEGNALFAIRRQMPDLERLVRADIAFHLVLLGLFFLVAVVAVAASYR